MDVVAEAMPAKAEDRFLTVAEIAAANLADQLLQLHLRHVRPVDVLIWTTIFHFDALRPTSPVLCV